VNEGKRGRRRKRNGPEQFQSHWLMLRNNCMILGRGRRSRSGPEQFWPPSSS